MVRSTSPRCVGVNSAGATGRVGKRGQAHPAGVQVLSRPVLEPRRANLRHDQRGSVWNGRLFAREYALVVDDSGLRR